MQYIIQQGQKSSRKTICAKLVILYKIFEASETYLGVNLVQVAFSLLFAKHTKNHNCKCLSLSRKNAKQIVEKGKTQKHFKTPGQLVV